MQLLLATAVTAKAPQAPQLQPSSHNCTGATNATRVCVLHDVLLRGTDVLYILPDPVVGSTSPADGASQSPAQQLAEQLTVSVALYHSWTSWAGQAHFFSPVLLPLSDAAALMEGHQGDAGAGGDSGRGAGEVLGDVVMYQMVAHWNHYHYAAEALPNIHMLACEHLGRCDYADRDFHLAPGGAHALPAPLPPGMQHLLSCVSRHPPLATHARGGAGAPPQRARRLVVGVGPRCRGPAPYCEADGPERQPIAPVSMRAVVASFHECLGLGGSLDARAPRPLPSPMHVLFVNRRSARRVPEDSMARAAAYVADAHGAVLTVAKMEGRTPKAQAATYKYTHALVQSGGAASPNLLYLPLGAAIALAYPVGFMGQSKYELDLVRDLNAAGRDITVVHAGEVPASHLLWREVLKQPGGPTEWTQLSQQERLAVLRAGRCPDELGTKCGNLGFFFVALELPPAFLDAALGGMRNLTGG